MHKVSIRLPLIGAVLAAVALAGPVAPAAADMATIEEATAEKVLGDPEAPVTMLAFESLSCPHCATFHAEAWPQVKEQYVDSGQVKFVYRDYPTNDAAVVAAMAARCVPPDRYFGMLEMLYRTQGTWLNSQDPQAALAQTARLGGLTQDEFEQCLENEDLYRSIQGNAQQASQQFGVSSTPTFIIGEQKIVGAQPFEVFQEAIDAELSGSGTGGGMSGTLYIAIAVAALAGIAGYFFWQRRSRKS